MHARFLFKCIIFTLSEYKDKGIFAHSEWCNIGMFDLFVFFFNKSFLIMFHPSFPTLMNWSMHFIKWHLYNCSGILILSLLVCNRGRATLSFQPAGTTIGIINGLSFCTGLVWEVFLECTGLFIICKVIPFQDFILAEFNYEVNYKSWAKGKFKHNMWTVVMRYH